MPKTFTVADDHVHALIREIMADTHPHLAAAGVTFAALLQRGGLKHRGYAALAVVKVNPLKDRVEGKADFTVTFDGDSFPSWPDTQLRAVIDHELTHVTLVTEKEGPIAGQVRADDIGRPCLKLRLHDVEIGCFLEVVDRHRDAAVEARAVLSAAREVRSRLPD